MVALHGMALLFDPVLRFGFLAVLVPGAAPWRPVSVAAGIVTAWLMLVLASSFNARRRIGQRRWRQLHYASFAAFSLGLYHALRRAAISRAHAGSCFAAGALVPFYG